LAELFTQTKAAEETKDPKILYLAITSDGGLCGGIHSAITRYIKKAQAAAPGALSIVGEKPKAQLSRAMPQALNITFSGVGKDVPTFSEASAIADEIMKLDAEFDEVSQVMIEKWTQLTQYRSESSPTNTFLPSLTNPEPPPSSLPRLYRPPPVSRLTKWRRMFPRIWPSLLLPTPSLPLSSRVTPPRSLPDEPPWRTLLT
jgi:hypothetical protein